MESGSARFYFGDVRRQALFVVLLAALLVTAGCAFPPYPGSSRPVHRPTPQTTPSSPLASQTVYWNQALSLWALRASDGHVRWNIGGWSGPLPGCSGCTYSVGPGDPALADGALYTLTTNDQASSAVYSYNINDGTSRWQTPVKGCLAFPGSPPLAAAGVLYVALTNHRSSNLKCGWNSWVYALRASDGHILWQVPFTPSAFSTLALTDGVIVVSDSTYPANPEIISLIGLRASDGKQLWRISDTKNIHGYIARDGVVFVARTRGIRYDSGLNIEAFRVRDGARLWVTTVMNSGSGGSAPYLANGMIYVYNSDRSYLYALRATDGKVVQRFQTGAQFTGTPVFANGRIYVGAGPALDVFDATSGALVRSYPLFDPLTVPSNARFVWSDPVVTNMAIFVSAGYWDCPAESICHADSLIGKLYALDIATGEVLWQYQAPNGYGVATPILGT